MNKILLVVLIVLGVLVVSVAAIGIMSASRVKFEKPAVYLYPESDSIIDVKIETTGDIIVSEPDYNNGWNVFVTREGEIEGTYDYLFYEVEFKKKIELENEGWVVPYNELEEWMDTVLFDLGLNEKEQSQFKEYWINRLPKANYYEIKLLSQEFLKEEMDLIITPEPDTILRLNFYFKALKETLSSETAGAPKDELLSETSLEEPKINTPSREGFTVVEWGGVLEK
ncbi:MAG: hypothetical protein ABIB43_02975 [archaeon]